MGKVVTFFKIAMYHSLFLMFFHYHHDYGQAISLEPPLQFGNLSVYHTRTKSCFAHTVRCCLSFTVLFSSQSSTVLELVANRHYVQFGDFKSSVKTYLSML